ncbi:MAG TPA: enoyl-CoA hydratase-related protein, partial [Steroidobacteraceae bacterium]|nr:enoyl-CoA hydratase-related protein [Steroidobacteraceae bacterium]
ALTEVRLGIVPAAISPYVVTAIGNRNARRLFLTAAPFDAAEARSIGLLHFTTSTEQLDAVVATQVDHLLRGGPEALRAAKKLVRRMSGLGDRDVLGEETARLLARLRVSPEGREGLSAFLERRKPNWHPGE